MVLILLLVVLLAPTAAWAQHEQHTTSPPPQGWSTSAAAQAFVTLNLQQRKFNDVSQVESTNWVMGRVVRRSSRTKVTFIGMASAEPFTLRRLGSAQVFQAGETLDDLPLRDYQHPHDLVMSLTGRLDWQLNARHSVFATAGPVGSPALGPTAFMHPHHARRDHGRGNDRRVDSGRLSVSWSRARRGSRWSRPGSDRQRVRAVVVAIGRVARTGLRRSR
jgi:hypothetical protein